MGDWQGFTAKEMADRMAKRATRLLGDGAFTGVPTSSLLDQGADMIRHQAAEIERLRDAFAAAAVAAAEHIMGDERWTNCCDLCGEVWPCPTSKTTAAALTGGDDG